jgi:hypothetical protein
MKLGIASLFNKSVPIIKTCGNKPFSKSHNNNNKKIDSPMCRIKEEKWFISITYGPTS